MERDQPEPALRGEWIDLFAAYGARVRIVYVEVPRARLRDAEPRAAPPVPGAVIERMLDRWEVPDLTEAHQVQFLTSPTARR